MKHKNVKMRILAMAAAIVTALALLPGSTLAENNVNTQELSVTAAIREDTKYHAATVELTPENFEKSGFSLGDSCDVRFENGYEILDVPYYNGYYVKNAEPVIVAYPGFDNILITFNNVGIWNEAGLKNGETVTISLREAGKYAAVQSALGQSYSFLREKYTSDEQFANFRPLTGGSLKENFLFRGASPVDNSRGRAAYADRLFAEHGIQTIIDLADSREDLEGYYAGEDFSSSYARSIDEKGRLIALDMGSAYSSQGYMQSVACGCRAMLDTEGPCYIHCMEGKDRTGFVCILLEALAGASYDEMLQDYMTTYANYYGVTPDETPEKYAAIAALYFDTMAAFLHGREDVTELKQADYQQDAIDYLLRGGMIDMDIMQLRAMITVE